MAGDDLWRRPVKLMVLTPGARIGKMVAEGGLAAHNRH